MSTHALRRLHIFKHIGLSCWQVYRQYFDPSVEPKLLDIRHKDGLGFSYVTTVLKPPPALIGFFSKTLPKYAATFRARFDEQRPLLQRYAIDLGLEEDTPAFMRTNLFNNFRKELLTLPDPYMPSDEFF